jgi:CSLREA domain-containing protein
MELLRDGREGRMFCLHPIARLASIAVAAGTLALVLVAGSAARISVTTIVVTTTADGADLAPGDKVCKAKLLIMQKPGAGTCTLRAAIQTASAGPRGTYVIVLPAGTLRLGVGGKGEDKAAKGDLDLNQANLTLVGKGPAKTTIDGGGIDRVLDVPPFSYVTVSDLRIVGGAAVENVGGGGALVRGAATFVRVVFDGDSASSRKGGGLYVIPHASAVLRQVTFVHNVADVGAGAYAAGKAQFTNVTFSGNNSAKGGGGLFVDGTGSALLLHVTITGNTGPGAAAIVVNGGGGFGMNGSIVEGSCFFGNAVFPQRNLVSNESCGGLVAPELGLGPLTVSGNGVPTHPLTAASPGVDFAFANTCPNVDARGVKRPQGAGCDAGAYELAP